MKVAIVIFAGTERMEDIARVHNALIAAKEFKEKGDDWLLIFDGAGTKWLKDLSNPQHMFYSLFQSLRGVSVCACEFCANALGVKGDIDRWNVPYMHEYEGHPSYRKLLSKGYQIISF